MDVLQRDRRRACWSECSRLQFGPRLHSCSGRLLRATGLGGWPILPVPASRKGAPSGNATPSPATLGAGIVRTVRLNTELLRDSSSFRQPPRARGFSAFLRPLGGPARGGLGGRLAPRRRRPWPSPLAPSWRLLGSLNLAWTVFLALAQPCWRPVSGLPAALPGRNRPERRIRQRPADGRRHVGDRGHAVDRPQRALAPVVIHQRRGLGLIGRQTLLEHLRVVVGPQRLAARLHLLDPAGDSADQDVRDRPPAPPRRRAGAPSRRACGRAPRPAARCAESRPG